MKYIRCFVNDRRKKQINNNNNRNTETQIFWFCVLMRISWRLRLVHGIYWWMITRQPHWRHVCLAHSINSFYFTHGRICLRLFVNETQNILSLWASDHFGSIQFYKQNRTTHRSKMCKQTFQCENVHQMLVLCVFLYLRSIEKNFFF